MGGVRYNFVLLGMLFLAIVLGVRLSTLQVIDGVEHGYEYLKKQGESRTIREELIAAQRGMILDRNGAPLAVSTKLYSLIADPKKIIDKFDLMNREKPKKYKKGPAGEKARTKDEERAAGLKKKWEDLASLLGLSAHDLGVFILRHKDRRFAYLKRQITPDMIGQFLELSVPGVYSEEENKRFYPAGEVVSHLVGITNVDDKGQEGLELEYDQWLGGKNGRKQVIKDLKGRTIRDVRLLDKEVPGGKLETSIDLRLQYLAYRELKAAVTKHKAKGGSVVVLDVKTGEVLAMANQPAVNPNDRSSIKPTELRNRAITDAFEPGSTVKPFTMLAALESGSFTPTTKVNTSPGSIKVGRKILHDQRDYGLLSMAEILQKSSQVGTTKIALSLKEGLQLDALKRAGLGQNPGGEFPGKSKGVLERPESWTNIDKATMSYGYGMTTTLLQLARAYTVFANGGNLIDISLIKRDKPKRSKKVFKKKDVSSLMDMMRLVTLEGGTGRKAVVSGYSVAGKTGTSHKYNEKGYSEDQYVSSFVGLVPSNKPKVVIAVMVDEPSAGKYFGGDVAAPIFTSVAASAMRVLNIKPDEAGRFIKVSQR
ncbi:MAG: penicillin-binding protein 2 [Pseudomonadota bacterium]